MTEEFIRHAEERGEDGKQWLERIPEIIAECEQKWQISVLPPFKLTWNYVAPAKQTDGTEVVLKIGFPKDSEFQSEISALKVFKGKGKGIELLLKEDSQNAAILIEQVSPGVPLSELTDDGEATRILAKVMKKLWKPAPPGSNFTTVLERSKDLFKVQEWFRGKTGPLPEHLVLKAQQYFKDLSASQDTPVLMHGDLHHDNVLSSERDGWLAIDPKGIIAEPCYEVAAMIRNPYEKLKDIQNLEPLLKRRIRILSEELRFDPLRIQRWCIAQCILSAVWNMEGHKGWEHGIRVAVALENITLDK